MHTTNKLILVAVCATLAGCATSRTPVMTLREAENYQINCKLKNEQIDFLERFVSDYRTIDAQLNLQTQSVLRRKLRYIHDYCL